MSKAFLAFLASVNALVSGPALAADGDGTPQPSKPANDSWLQRTGDFPKQPAKPVLTPEEKKARRAERQKQLEAADKGGMTHSLPLKGGFGSAGGRQEKALRDPEEKERQKSLNEQSKKGSGQ
jgi:hypothetical protein